MYVCQLPKEVQGYIADKVREYLTTTHQYTQEEVEQGVALAMDSKVSDLSEVLGDA